MLLDFIFGAIVLILIGFGIYKGLTGLFFGTFSIVLSLIIAFFLADVVAQQIFESPLGSVLTDYITGKLSSLGEVATAPIVIVGEDYYLETSEGQVALAEALKGFGPLSKIITKYAYSYLPSVDIEGMSLADKFVPSIAMLVLSMAAGLLLFILAAIIFKIFSKITEEWDQNPVFNKINRVLGFLLTAFIGIMIINFLMLAAAEAPHVKLFNALAEMTEGTYMSKYFYEHNWLKNGLTSMGVDVSEMFNRYFPAKAD
ncbi:MAG: hypothetical protein ACOX3U_05910 [Christensenellales bacterium]|jgi:uncharacterized membrane protein required for colicin V production